VAEELAGKPLGKYELQERIGRGGMAEVYRAYHAILDRNVAIKILHPFLGDDPEFKGRFETEARNVARLRHPNIVQVYDFEHDPKLDLYYMVMEYIDGPTLRTRLIQLNFEGMRFPIPDAIRITRSLTDALAYAHSRGMVHRDIKPGNVMFDSDGRVVLTDFGIARIVSGPNMTASGSMVGTPAYMSPEQGLGQSGDHRSDIYSLGVVLYQLVTGRTPFDADTPIAIVLKHVNDPLPPPSSIVPDIPEGLERILYKALAKSPDERYQSIEEMARHLDDLEAAAKMVVPASSQAGLAVPSVAAPRGTEEPSAETVGQLEPAQRRGCLIWSTLLGVALIAMLSGAYMSFSGLLGQYLPFVPDMVLVLTETPTPTLTLTPTAIVTPTDLPQGALEATAVSQTVEAVATLIAATPSAGAPSADQTATTAACEYAYDVIGQTPTNGTLYPELTTLTLQVELRNASLCPLPAGTRLVFVDGYQLSGPNSVTITQSVQPGSTTTIVLNLKTPSYSASVPIVRSNWALITQDGIQIGPPVIFELKLFAILSATPPPATQPTAASTPGG
jgi:serine/threonine protein kinase